MTAKRCRILLLTSILLPLSLRTASPAFTGTVEVRLFAESKVRRLKVRGSGAWRLNQRSPLGPIRLEAILGRVRMTDLRGHIHEFSHVTIEAGDGAVALELWSGADRQTTGRIDIDATGSTLQIINTMDLETYIAGIAPAELASVPKQPQTYIAQMVTSRSYVLSMLNRHRRQGFDFCDGPHCQAYRGLRQVNAMILDAASRSRGQYLSFRGRPIAAFYTDTCGGATASNHDVWKTPDLPYLSAHRDGPGDGYCKHSPRAQWSYAIPKSAMRKIVHENQWLLPFQALDGLRVVRTDRFGRARQILVQTDHPKWVPAAQFRRAINRHLGGEPIPSTHFTIQSEANVFRIYGHGWGHGVGLCQWGASEMARQGRSYQQILTHYFPGTRLAKLPRNRDRALPIDLARHIQALSTVSTALIGPPLPSLQSGSVRRVSAWRTGPHERELPAGIY